MLETGVIFFTFVSWRLRVLRRDIYQRYDLNNISVFKYFTTKAGKAGQTFGLGRTGRFGHRPYKNGYFAQFYRSTIPLTRAETWKDYTQHKDFLEFYQSRIGTYLMSIVTHWLIGDGDHKKNSSRQSEHVNISTDMKSEIHFSVADPFRSNISLPPRHHFPETIIFKSTT